MSSLGYMRGAALIAAAAIAGCAGNGKGLDANGNPITAGEGSIPLTDTLESIQANVFTPICTKCHIGAGAPEGLQLDAAHAYSLLVGVPSAEQPDVLRVDQGNPNSSYIILKLEGAPSISGARMPFGGPYLPQSTINVIAEWITNGAQNATTSNVAMAVKATQRFKILASSPDDSSVAAIAMPRVVVAFSSDIDPSLVNSTTVILEKVGQTAPIPITTSIPKGDGSALLITPLMPLGNGTYQVTLRGSLADMDANALGSDDSFTFTVDATP